MSLWTDAEWRLLADACEGRLSSDDARRFAQWVAAHPERADAVARVRAAWGIAGYPRRQPWPLDEMLAKVDRVRHATSVEIGASEISGDVRLDTPQVRRAVRSLSDASRPMSWWRSWRPMIVVVAIVGAVVGLASRVAHRPVGDRGQLDGKSYTTDIGQRAVVTLRDGTRVMLAPGTTLRVADGFGAHTRVVTVSGAAHFDVSNTVRIPFLVRTGAVTTRVLGTTFTVARYPDDASTRVVVMSGKVLVGAETRWHPSMILAANAVGVVTDSSATLVTATSQDTSWTNGRLIFHRAPTADVLAALTRWYGYQFRLTDSVLARQNLTVGISTESASAALATLKLALDADLSYAGGVVTLSPHRSGSRDMPKTRDSRDALSPHTREVGR